MTNATYTTAEKVFYALVFAALLALAAHQMAERLLPDSEFEYGLDSYSSSPGRLNPIKGAFALESDGETVAQSKGPTNIISTRSIRIDPATSYRMQVRVRALVGEGVIIAGVLQFDAERRRLATNGQQTFFRRTIKRADGWVVGDGEIKLSPATAFVKPIAILNHSAPDAVSQIDYLRFFEAH